MRLCLAAGVCGCTFATLHLLSNFKDDSSASVPQIPRVGRSNSTNHATVAMTVEDACVGEEQVPVDNNTCFHYMYESHPQVAQECGKQPDLPLCDMDCFDSVADRPSPISVDKKYTASSSSTLWPSLQNSGGRGGGEWVQDETYCQDVAGTVNQCLFDTYRYQLPDGLEAWTTDTTCQLLRQHEITDVLFLGDSLIRHAAQAMVLFLKNNLQFSTTMPGMDECTGHQAFANVSCRVDSFVHSVCQEEVDLGNNAPVRVHFRLHKPNIRLRQEDFWVTTTTTNHSTLANDQEKTLVCFGIGNHPPTGAGSPVSRLGILNLRAYKRKQLRPTVVMVPQVWGASNYLVWMPTHFKLRVGRTDESNERALQFLWESHAFLANLGAATVNTFSMTEQASRFFVRSRCDDDDDIHNKARCQTYRQVVVKRNEAPTRTSCQQPTMETWDGYHYAYTMNAWKAQLLLHRFHLLVSTGSTTT